MTVRPIRPSAERSMAQAVAAGQLVVVSGQVASNADGEVVGGEDAYEQARQCFANLLGVLAEAGAGPSEVVKLNAYLTDAAHYDGYRRAKNEALTGCTPTGTVVVVAALLRPELLMEVEAMAWVE